MVLKIKKCFSDKRMLFRLLASICLFFALFFLFAVISYMVLPEGILKAENPMSNFSTSNNLFLSAVQIFSYNLISIVVIAFGSLFAFSNRNDSFLSYGYVALGTQFSINAIVVGTWSFSATNFAAPGLSTRLINMFDILHRSGLWEMMGQLIITCALARIAFVKTNGKITESSPFKDIQLSRTEIFAIVIGLLLMIIGAFIESYTIINNM